MINCIVIHDIVHVHVHACAMSVICYFIIPVLFFSVTASSFVKLIVVTFPLWSSQSPSPLPPTDWWVVPTQIHATTTTMSLYEAKIFGGEYISCIYACIWNYQIKIQLYAQIQFIIILLQGVSSLRSLTPSPPPPPHTLHTCICAICMCCWWPLPRRFVWCAACKHHRAHADHVTVSIS
jgi:hypothetical protein